MSDNKTDNNSTPILELTNSRTLTDLMDESALLLFPGKKEWRQRFCYTLLVWSRKSTSLDMQQFCDEYNYVRSMVYLWIDKYPTDIGKAWKNAKLTVAARHRIGALEKKYDKDVVYKAMHLMDPDYLAINEYHAQLKSKEREDLHEKVQFVILPAPKTGKVKPRKLKEIDVSKDKEPLNG